ncbi:MAG TPA: tyrosine-type recombinase/integrase [Candidatus Limnocylindrales bacterium]|nr:tyrosine-type recombinase/integrase [Candidatus Limnocylindrales bacterium]
MKTRYRLIRRGVRNGAFYCVDTSTGKRTSLRTGSEDEARQFVEAKNQAQRQPEINLQIAKAYLAAADESFVNRTWQEVMVEFVNCKTGSNRIRCERAIIAKPFDSIRDLQLIETRSEHFLRVLENAKVSTNNYLRRFHNFALDMGWLPWPVLPKRRWPVVRYKEKRAITREEHELILSRERNPEMRAFLRCCWHIGGSQSDVAHLKAEDVDWQAQVVSFFRAKTGTAQIIHFGSALAEVLRDLPGSGLLFPRLVAMDEKHRAALFQRGCRREGITGISLHSYRYAWAERAKKVGYPERFAQQALGHNSKAVHRAYAKKAQFTLPSLEEYEQRTT